MTSSSPSAAAAAAAVAADGAAPTHHHTSPDMMDLDMDAKKPPPQEPPPEDAVGETQDSKINDAPPDSTFPTAPDPIESKPGNSIVDATPIEKDQPPPAAPNPSSATDGSNQTSTKASLQDIKVEALDKSPSARPETPINEESTTHDQPQSERQDDVPKTPLPSNQTLTNSADLGLSDTQVNMAIPYANNVLGEAAQIVPQMEDRLDAGTINGELPQPSQPLYTVGPHMFFSRPDNFKDMEYGKSYSLGGRIPPYATPVQSRTQPTTVTPQQVFPGMLFKSQNTNQPVAPVVAQAQAQAQANLEDNRPKNYLPCFAELKFADGGFALTTYEVVIGRDLAAIRKAAKNEKRARLLGPTTVTESHVAGNRRYARSYVSEKGGILGPESESGNEAGHSRHKSRSIEGGDAMDVDRKEEESQGDRRYIPFPEEDGDVDTDEVKTAAGNSCFLGIHSPGPDIATKSKAISRRHVKIYYDKSERVFKIQSIHHNGYFLNDVLYRGGPHVLRNGDWLQIKDVRFEFIIPGVKAGSTGAEDLPSKERVQRGGKEMSFDFSSNRVGNMRDTSEELSSPDEKMLEDVEEDMQQHVEKAEKTEKKSKKVSPKRSPKTSPKKAPKTSPKAAGVQSDSPADSPAAATAAAAVATAAAAAAAQPEPNGEARVSLPQAKPAVFEDLPAGIDPELAGLVPEGFFKKRGPGRPPKNGVMSKRQQRELKKLVEASEKAKAAELPQPEEPIKRKVGRPRKHQLPDDAEMPPEKRKATEGDPEPISGGEEKKVKEKKTKVPRIKSPPLELIRTEYTEEQLAKPSKNYCQMIDEVLTPVGREGITLKQIYKRIALAHPFFHFNAGTKGWESSVRHNLIGNDAFAKDDDRGTWYRTEISLDAGKKTQKRERSPVLHQGAPIPQGQYYPGSQQAMPHPHNGYMHQQYPQQYPVQNQQIQQMDHPQRPAQYGQSASQPVAAPNQHSIAQHPPFTAASTAAQAHSNTAHKAPYAQSSQQQQQQQPASQFRPANGGPLPQQPAQKTAQQPASTTGPSQSPQPDSKASNPPDVKAHIEPILVQLLNRTLTHLHRGLSEVKCPNPDEIIWSAVDRALGIRKEVPRDGNFKQMETIAGKGLQDLLDGTIPKYRPNNADGTPAHKTLLHPETTRHLVSFRDSCINTLKNRFAEEEAVELTNSAITQAFGFTGRPMPTKDLSKRFFEVLQVNVRSMLNRLPSHFRSKEHEALLRGGTPGSRSAATPTPVPASVSPAAPAGANAVPVPTVQRSTPVPPMSPQTTAKPALPQPSAATGTSVYARPQGQNVMSPPVQGPPPQAPSPAAQASATAAAPTPAKQAVPSQPPAQVHARPQTQAATPSPASAPVTQPPQPQPQQQKPVQAQGPAPTTAPSTSTSASTIQPAMFRPLVHTQAQTQSQSSTSIQPPIAAPAASSAPASAAPSVTPEAQPKPQPQTQTPTQEQVSPQRQPSPKVQASGPAQQPEVKTQEAQAPQPAGNPSSGSQG